LSGWNTWGRKRNFSDLERREIYVFSCLQGKGKKTKKGKMLKVDSRILGFSVTAAPDRIVGDRDYGEGL